jgi:signal transduction histidine kinase
MNLVDRLPHLVERGSRAHRLRVGTALAALALYAAVYFPLSARIGPGAASLTFVPIVVSALLLGIPGGIACALLGMPLNHALQGVQGYAPLWEFVPSDLYYGAVGIGIGLIVGSLQRLRSRMRDHVANEMLAREIAQATAARLRESEARWRALIEHAPGTIAIIGRGGRIEFVNKQGDQNAPPEGASAYGFAVDPHRLSDVLADVFRERKTVQFEMQSRTPDGTRRWHSVSAGPLVVAGEVDSAILLTTDITEKKQADEAIRQSEKFATLGSLSAGVAHEINNPLAFMGLETDMFLATLGSAERDALSAGWRETAERFARTNKQGVERVAKIVQSLRTLSKPHADASQLALKPIVEATVTLAHTSLRNRNVAIDIPDGVAVHALGDHVGQIVLNLVINAADACPNVGGRIVVDARTRDGRTTLRVTDNGHGIPPEARGKIFTQFFTTKKKGTGLGLAICKRLAEENGGSLRFEDAEGGGTVFLLDLPAQAPRPTPALRSSA